MDLLLTNVHILGQLASTQVQLTKNGLSRFDSDVFQSMLEDMTNETGRVELYFSKCRLFY